MYCLNDLFQMCLPGWKYPRVHNSFPGIDGKMYPLRLILLNYSKLFFLSMFNIKLLTIFLFVKRI